MKPLEPIYAVELFPELHAELLALLRGLTEEDWAKPTVAPLWSVKDIAAHVLDTDIRRLALQRDRLLLPQPDTPIASYNALVAYINQLNQDWVRVARRFSPRLLISFLELIGREVYALYQSLDPHAPAIFPVAWAGEEVSPNWFDIARELTEKWHHQQQIRDAVGAPAIIGRKFLHPVLDTFLRGLPHTYKDIEARTGATINLTIRGEAGGEWALVKQEQGWQLFSGHGDTAEARVAMDQDIAWRLFTKGLDRKAARQHLQIEGDDALGSGLLNLLAIMAIADAK